MFTGFGAVTAGNAFWMWMRLPEVHNLVQYQVLLGFALCITGYFLDKWCEKEVAE